MRRLEELTQSSLFRREGRNLVLTESGELLVIHAREILRANDRAISALAQSATKGPIQVGLTQVLAEILVPTVLTRFARLYPDIHIHLRVNNSRELQELTRNNHLDLSLGLANPESRSAVGVDELIWIGDDALFAQRTVPLAVMDAPCICRDAAIAAMEAAGISYRIVVETSNLAILSAAVRSGLAITCQPSIYVSSHLQACAAGRPKLPNVGYVLRTSTPSSAYVEKLSAIIVAALPNHQLCRPEDSRTKPYQAGGWLPARSDFNEPVGQLLGL
jgi:DNA-binding transcriptional LysR family regulator